MSYRTVALSSDDAALIDRIEAAAVAEAWNNPATAGSEFGRNVRLSPTNGRLLVYPVCVAADVEAAYASALAAGIPDPGADETVVTDAMILANVQTKWPADPT
jgi:hypothetical protein